MTINPASCDVYSIYWKETLTASSTALAFIVTTIVLTLLLRVQFPPKTIATTLFALEGASFITFSISFALLRKKASFEAPLKHNFNLLQLPVPPSSEETDFFLLDSNEEVSSTDSFYLEDEIGIVSDEEECLPEDVVHEFHANVLSLASSYKNFFLTLLKGYYLSQKRDLIFSSKEADIEKFEKHFTVILDVLDKTISDPYIFWPIALNYLVSFLNKEKFDDCLATSTDKDFVNTLLMESFTLKGNAAPSFQQFLENVYQNVVDKPNFLNEETAQLIREIRAAFKEGTKAPTLKKAIFALLSHLFQQSKFEKDKIINWMLPLLWPILKKFELDPQSFYKVISYVKKEFRKDGRMNEQAAINQLKKSFPDSIAPIIFAGITSPPGIKAVLTFYFNPLVEKKLTELTISHRKEEFKQAIDGLVSLLAKPFLCGFYKDADPLCIKMKEIVQNSEQNEENKETFQSVERFLDSLSKGLENAYFKKY